jgi:formate hydrogenlyase subunit 3/multisubunit Na+/H+ antiporter MnhD subunit
LFSDLLLRADRMDRSWLRAAFVLLLVGYGTKMGLAPMHTWKPDAYGEAPGVVGALLAGGLTSCAFLALSRVFHICAAAGELASRLLVFFGLSIAVAPSSWSASATSSGCWPTRVSSTWGYWCWASVWEALASSRPGCTC